MQNNAPKHKTNYEDLDVYKSIYQFLLLISNANLNKKYKYTLGDKLIENSTEIILLIAQILKTKEKEAKMYQIDEALEKVEKLLLFSRLLKDLNAISTNFLASTSIHLVSTREQLNKWKKTFR